MSHQCSFWAASNRRDPFTHGHMYGTNDMSKNNWQNTKFPPSIVYKKEGRMEIFSILRWRGSPILVAGTEAPCNNHKSSLEIAGEEIYDLAWKGTYCNYMNYFSLKRKKVEAFMGSSHKNELDAAKEAPLQSWVKYIWNFLSFRCLVNVLTPTNQISWTPMEIHTWPYILIEISCLIPQSPSHHLIIKVHKSKCFSDILEGNCHLQLLTMDLSMPVNGIFQPSFFSYMRCKVS